MKILQISSAQSLGGGERHLADLANGLALRGHSVHVAVRPNSPLINELKKIPSENITILPLRNALDVKSARDLSKLVRRNQIQIVHAHMARDYSLAKYASIGNGELIITRHVLFALNRLHRITLLKAARVIAVSQAVANQLSAAHIVEDERISIVHNGVDGDRFARARNNFSRPKFIDHWKLPKDSLLVGTVGQLTPLKGHEEFLAAAALIAKKRSNAYFFIAGLDTSRGKKYRTFLENTIATLKLTDRVRLVEWLDDITQLYCALDVFVSASRTESFGLAIAEAMASSTAVVATETEGAREIIASEKIGLLIPVGDAQALARAVIRLLNEDEKRTHMGQAAQKEVTTKFSLEQMIEKTERIYSQVVDSSLKCNTP